MSAASPSWANRSLGAASSSASALKRWASSAATLGEERVGQLVGDRCEERALSHRRQFLVATSKRRLCLDRLTRQELNSSYHLAIRSRV